MDGRRRHAAPVGVFEATEGRLLAKGNSAVAILWWHRHGTALDGRLRSVVVAGTGPARSVTRSGRRPGRTDGGFDGHRSDRSGRRPESADAGGGSLTLSVPTADGSATMVFRADGVGGFPHRGDRPPGGGRRRAGERPVRRPPAERPDRGRAVVATSLATFDQDEGTLFEAAVRMPQAVTQVRADLGLVTQDAAPDRSPVADGGSSGTGSSAAVCGTVPVLEAGAAKVGSDEAAVAADAKVVKTDLTGLRVAADALLARALHRLTYAEASSPSPVAPPPDTPTAMLALAGTERSEWTAVAPRTNQAIDQAVSETGHAYGTPIRPSPPGHCPLPRPVGPRAPAHISYSRRSPTMTR